MQLSAYRFLFWKLHFWISRKIECHMFVHNDCVISFLKNVTQWACDSIDCGKYLCTLARWIVTAKKDLHSVHWVLKQSKTKKINKIKRICSDILNTTLCWKKLQKDGMGATRCKAAWSWPKNCCAVACTWIALDASQIFLNQIIVKKL